MTAENVGAPDLADLVAGIGARARDLDAGRTDTRVDITHAGAAGLLGVGLAGTSLAGMAEIIEQVSSASVSAGFSLWAQRMAAEYLARAPRKLRDRHLDRLVAGERIGVTAMAAGMKQVAGLGDVPVCARREGSRLVADGPIRWASNVYPEALIVLPVRVDDGTTRVVAIDADTRGVEIRPEPDLMGLGATASTSLVLAQVEIADTDTVANDLTAFVGSIRPAFLLLQSAFCSGGAGAALAGAQESLTGVNEVFDDEHRVLSAAHRDARERLYAYSRDPGRSTPAELIRLRLDIARIAVGASRLEATTRGGAGYATGTDTNRRFREIAFIPIQSPSEGQLRWELKQFE